jgi:hypothetical protein
MLPNTQHEQATVNRSGTPNACLKELVGGVAFGHKKLNPKWSGSESSYLLLPAKIQPKVGSEELPDAAVAAKTVPRCSKLCLPTSSRRQEFRS